MESGIVFLLINMVVIQPVPAVLPVIFVENVSNQEDNIDLKYVSERR